MSNPTSGTTATRADFSPVGWGTKGAVRERVGDEPAPLVQMWFAGNHSDIGESYPEAESRLSDIALGWMVEEATGIPHPLLVDGMELGKPGTGCLRLHPAADGMPHCEVAGMHDAIAGIFPNWLVPWLDWLGWSEKPRQVPDDAPVHPTVRERFAMAEVTQCAGRGPYRPVALTSHKEFRYLFVRPPRQSE